MFQDALIILNIINLRPEMPADVLDIDRLLPGHAVNNIFPPDAVLLAVEQVLHPKDK